MSEEVIEIDPIIKKLMKANIAEIHKTGYRGEFYIRQNGHLLDPEELFLWLIVLHQGSSHDDKICGDLHTWNVDLTG